jgi:hypothetical protein
VDAIVAREVRLFNDRNEHGPVVYHLPKTGPYRVQVFGSFRRLSLYVCAGRGSCPFHESGGTSLQLVISPRTHRLFSAKLSPEISPTQAPAIARGSNRVFSIFPSAPGHRDCSIPEGGVRLPRTPGLPARCTTEFTTYRPPRGVIHIRFNERWNMDGHLQVAAWIVGVRLSDGRVLPDYQVIGEPPQLRK